MWEIKLTDVVFYNESAAGGKVTPVIRVHSLVATHSDSDMTDRTATKTTQLTSPADQNLPLDSRRVTGPISPLDQRVTNIRESGFQGPGTNDV